jgi:prolyl oligopeptidase
MTTTTTRTHIPKRKKRLQTSTAVHWLVSACALGLGVAPAAAQLDYPETQKVEVSDSYFGTEVKDPFRWLEEDVRNSQEVRDWVTAQNELTFGYLQQIPGREIFKERLTKLWDYAQRSAPFDQNGRWFQYRKDDGLQNHWILYTSTSAQGPWEVLFDPNQWSEDGTTALGGVSISESGRYVAYGIQEAGSDWRTWRVRDVETGEDLPDELRKLKFTGISWTHDDKGFFYSKYPDPAEGEAFTGLNLENKLMYHTLGTDQSEDVVVYWRPENPTWNYGSGVSDDGRYLLIVVSVGTDDKYRVYVKDLEHPYAAPVPIIDEFENSFGYIWNDGPIFYMTTDHNAPNERVIAINIHNPAPENWKEIIPEKSEPLGGVSFVNNTLICSYLRDVQTAIEMYSLDGELVRTVELPGVGTASGFGGEPDDTVTYYTFSSYAVPPSIFRYDMVSGESELYFQPDIDFDPDRFVTKQVFYESADGTRVPMFITHLKDLKLDGTNPTLLYAYGGFSISLRPGFSTSRVAWMEQGGVYVVANIRGGGEYGREWHEGGKKQNKQNVFDDFIGAAEALIAKGYTSPEHLAIQGGSNGGLLVGAAMAQRPDLFAVALPAVGVMDMLRFDEFTAGRYWTDDYGSAKESEDMFRYLLGYSPYHNLKDGTAYPATMVTTADTDDRVVPGHSFKFAARLQEAHEGEQPVLIRIETKAGHGSGKPTSMIIEELADVYAFTAKHTGLKVQN